MLGLFCYLKKWKVVKNERNVLLMIDINWECFNELEGRIEMFGKWINGHWNELFKRESKNWIRLDFEGIELSSRVNKNIGVEIVDWEGCHMSMVRYELDW